MDVDDDDTKIRRNLVVFSAAVLLLAWLEVPFSALVSKLVEPSQLQIENTKLSAAGLVILLYLAIRFSFSAEGSRYREALKRDLDHLLFRKVIAMARLQLWYHRLTGREPTIFAGKLKRHLQEKSAGLETSIENCERPRVDLSLSEHGQTKWSYLFSTTVAWHRNGKQVAASAGGSLLEVSVNGVDRFLVRVAAHLHTLLYSESSIQHLAPVIMGLAAGCLLSWRVIEPYIAA